MDKLEVGSTLLFENTGHPRFLFHLVSAFFEQDIQFPQQIILKIINFISAAGIQTHNLYIMSLLS